MIIDLKGGKIMENQTEIIEAVEQGSKKGKIGKLALVATGIAASVGAILLLRKRKLAKTENEEIQNDVSEDKDKESSEN